MAVQDVLASLQNPVASRNAILQRLNIDPNRAAGYGGNMGYDQKLADLYREGLQSSANLDTQEGNLGRQYEQSLTQAAIDRDKALKAIAGSYAQRGMTFSGANVDDVSAEQGNYDRYIANLGADRTAGLNSIGQQRLGLEQGLAAGKQAADEGFGGDVSAFLQQQAVDLWNSVMQQNQTNALLAAASRPPTVVRAPAPVAPKPVAPPTVLAPRPTSSGTLKGQGYGGKAF